MDQQREMFHFVYDGKWTKFETNVFKTLARHLYFITTYKAQINVSGVEIEFPVLKLSSNFNLHVVAK